VADLSSFSTQKLSIQVGSNAAVEVTITSANNSLTGLRDAINDAGTGVTASVVNDGSNYRLILSSDSTGASGRIIVKADENGDGTYTEAGGDIDSAGLSKLAFNATYDADGLVTGGTANMTQSQAALDAALTVNGLSVTRSSNEIDDLITGVTLNLLKTETTSNVKLTVSKDYSSGSAKASAFVSAYNSVMSLAKGLTSVTDGKKVLLTGDVTARSIMSGLRSAITARYDGLSAARMGISHDKNGMLTLDSSVFSAAMEDDIDAVAATLNSMGAALETTVSDFITTMIPARKTGIQNSISRLNDKIENINRNLTLKEKSYRDRFNAMEEILGKLQKNGDFLTQQFSNSSSK
jgi:flagellar hook-associated protein 2